MPEPVFSPEERVETAPALPAELVQKLQGKSAQEQTRLIIEHYSTRERSIIQQAKEAIRTQDTKKIPGHQETTPTRQETPTRVQTVDERELSGARATLISAAKQQAARDKKYWDRFLPQIEEIMKGMNPEFQVDLTYWETAYYNLVGMNKATLDREEREAEATAQRLTSERASAAHETPAVEVPLSPVVINKILPGLNITAEQYRQGEKNIQEGKWPLTFDKAAR